MSLKILRTPIIIGRHLAVLGVALGMLILFASSARVNVIQSAQVFLSPNCNTTVLSLQEHNLIRQMRLSVFHSLLQAALLQ